MASITSYSRTNGYMKDIPALLCAWLSSRDVRLHEVVFEQVIDNMKMLRTYVRILRSGVTGRKSLGTAPKRLVREWIVARSEEQLVRSRIGQRPSPGDIIKMVHLKPADVRDALQGCDGDRDCKRSWRGGQNVCVPGCIRVHAESGDWFVEGLDIGRDLCGCGWSDGGCDPAEEPPRRRLSCSRRTWYLSR